MREGHGYAESVWLVLVLDCGFFFPSLTAAFPLSPQVRISPLPPTTIPPAPSRLLTLVLQLASDDLGELYDYDQTLAFNNSLSLVFRTRTMSSSGPRHRPQATRDNDKNKSNASASVPDRLEDQTSRVISPLDIVRVIITLLGVSCTLSYYLTSGASIFWNYDPWFTHPTKLAQWWQGPLHLTPEQLATFDGSDRNKPILLAINGKIFDVSAGRHTYGPGGSYEVFAGRDATRAFVTGCFLEDRTGDLRGAEEIYIPIDDPEEEITSAQRKMRAERDRRKAKQKVQKEIEKWETFYKHHKKYFQVGELVGVPEYTGEPPKLCEPAQKGRPKRKNQRQDDDSEAPRKPVQ